MSLLRAPCARLVAQLYPTLCDPLDCSRPGSSFHGNFQGRILGWVAISSSRRSQPRDRTRISCVSCIAGKFFTHRATGEALNLGVWKQSLPLLAIWPEISHSLSKAFTSSENHGDTNTNLRGCHEDLANPHIKESHGRRSLVSYSPQGCKESDTTERLHFTSSIYKMIKIKPSTCSSLNMHERLINDDTTVISTTSAIFHEKPISGFSGDGQGEYAHKRVCVCVCVCGEGERKCL